MKAVILCGGQGTRLREETEFRPKPLVEVGGRPILWHIMKIYAHHGIKDFVLCLGYKGTMIKEYFLNYEAMNNDFSLRLGARHEMCFHGAHQEQDLFVTLADTGEDTMTGGRLARVQKYIDDDLFMATYGDGVADIDLGAVLEFHKSHGKVATLAAGKPLSRYGVLDVDDDGRVRRFVEKPGMEGRINIGFFVFDRRVFQYLGDDTCVLERAPFETLAREGELMAYLHDGFFFAMDTYREYKILNELYAEGNAPWKVW
jgi:glucose-1-phosphate cytidylyltransferase